MVVAMTLPAGAVTEDAPGKLGETSDPAEKPFPAQTVWTKLKPSDTTTQRKAKDMASKAETVRSIRAEWKAETGEDPGKGGAEVLLDQMCEAFFQKYHGYESKPMAIHEDRRTAEYLKWQWTGEEGAVLRGLIEVIDSGDCDCGATAACQKVAAAKKVRA